MAYQAVSITLPKGLVVVLYIGLQFGTFYSQEYSPGYQNMDPKVEVWCLVAYHYSPDPQFPLRISEIAHSNFPLDFRTYGTY